MIVSLIVALLVFGVALYLVTLVPMDPKVMLAIRAIILLVLVLWVLKALGVWNGRLP